MHNNLGDYAEGVTPKGISAGVSACLAQLASLKKSLKNPGMRMVGCSDLP